MKNNNKIIIECILCERSSSKKTKLTIQGFTKKYDLTKVKVPGSEYYLLLAITYAIINKKVYNFSRIEN